LIAIVVESALADFFLDLHGSLIVDLAGRFCLPAIGTTPSFAKAGGQIGHGNTISLVNQYRQAATYVDRILKGSKPGDLPVQGADRYTFVVNLKTAKPLGITFPETLKATAYEVIE
jgi:putative ABC transport system substrate-binding protein